MQIWSTSYLSFTPRGHWPLCSWSPRVGLVLHCSIDHPRIMIDQLVGRDPYTYCSRYNAAIAQGSSLRLQDERQKLIHNYYGFSCLWWCVGKQCMLQHILSPLFGTSGPHTVWPVINVLCYQPFISLCVVSMATQARWSSRCQACWKGEGRQAGGSCPT